MDFKALLGDKYSDELSAEDLLKALEGVELPNNSEELDKLRNALSKSNSEAADYKKQLRAKMSEDELAKQKAADAQSELEQKYNELLRKTNISENKAKLLTLGYDEKLAEKAAEAMADGNMEAVFEAQKTYLADYADKVRADYLKDTPKPVGNNGNSHVMTKQEFVKLSPMERLKFSQEHADEYKAMYEGGNE